MQLKPALAVLVLLGGVGAVHPAVAAVCALLVQGGTGALGDPTQGYTVMSSEDGGRQTSFTATIVGGSSTVTVGAPTVSYSGAHPHSGDVGQIKYRAVDTLGFLIKQQDYTGQASTFGISALLGVTAIATTTVDGKITNNSGFPQGDYQLRTVVTCS